MYIDYIYYVKVWTDLETYPDRKVHWANMLPTWVLSVPDWPNVDPMDLAFRVYCFLLEAALIIRSKCRLVNQPRGRLTAMVLSISHPKILNSYYDNLLHCYPLLQ